MPDTTTKNAAIPAVEAKGARIPLLGLGTWELRGRVCARVVEQALAARLPAHRHRGNVRQRARGRRGLAQLRRQAQRRFRDDENLADPFCSTRVRSRDAGVSGAVAFERGRSAACCTGRTRGCRLPKRSKFCARPSATGWRAISASPTSAYRRSKKRSGSASEPLVCESVRVSSVPRPVGADRCLPKAGHGGRCLQPDRARPRP